MDWDDEYEKAPIEERGSEIPDGSYRAQIKEVIRKDSKNSGKPMLAWKLTVVDGPFKKRMLFRNSMLPDRAESDEYNKDRLKYLKMDLHTCGVTMAKYSDLEHKLQDLIGVTLDVTVKSKGTNTNVYLNKIASPETADDLPF